MYRYGTLPVPYYTGLAPVPGTFDAIFLTLLKTKVLSKGIASSNVVKIGKGYKSEGVKPDWIVDCKIF